MSGNLDLGCVKPAMLLLLGPRQRSCKPSTWVGVSPAQELPGVLFWLEVQHEGTLPSPLYDVTMCPRGPPLMVTLFVL